MPLTAQEKAERRAKAALDAGRTFHPRTASNKAVLERVCEEASTERKALVRKTIRKGCFALRNHAKTKLDEYKLQLVQCAPVMDPSEGFVRAAADALAEQGCDAEKLLSEPLFVIYVERLYFSGVDAKEAGNRAVEALAAARELEYARREREYARCWREQEIWEQTRELRARAESYAAEKLWAMNKRKKCEECRAVQRNSCNERCVPHQAGFEALCAEYLKLSAQTKWPSWDGPSFRFLTRARCPDVEHN